MKNEIEHLLFKTKRVVNFDAKEYIEVQPGRMSPLFINIKNTFGNPEARHKIARELAKRVNPISVCICGIESGGSYYASAVADMLKKPLVLFRKKEKEYGTYGRFVGTIPKIKNGLVTIVDDIFAGGVISTANNKALTDLGYRSELIVIYSFLPKVIGPMSRIKVSVLSDTNSLCAVGQRLKFFKKSDVELIKKECVYSNK